MQIQLKQVEIVSALKQYITQKGIDLSGKEVSISFTAGRKEGGITADLSIEDSEIPGFSGPEPVALSLVSSHPIPDAPVGLSPTVADAVVEVVDEPVVAKSVSLFN